MTPNGRRTHRSAYALVAIKGMIGAGRTPENALWQVARLGGSIAATARASWRGATVAAKHEGGAALEQARGWLRGSTTDSRVQRCTPCVPATRSPRPATGPVGAAPSRGRAARRRRRRSTQGPRMSNHIRTPVRRLRRARRKHGHRPPRGRARPRHRARAGGRPPWARAWLQAHHPRPHRPRVHRFDGPAARGHRARSRQLRRLRVRDHGSGRRGAEGPATDRPRRDAPAGPRRRLGPRRRQHQRQAPRDPSPASG